MILMNNDEFFIDQKRRRKQNAEPQKANPTTKQ